MAQASHPKFVRWAVLIGIVISLNLFFVVGRSLVIPEPRYEDFCPVTLQPAATPEACELQEGVWVEIPGDSQVSAVTKPNTQGYCDLYQTCQPLYDAASKEYQMISFVVMMGLGILSLIAGVIPIGSSIVSSGLSYGGVLALLIAAGGYWDEAGNLVKFGMSAVALVALLYIGARRFKD